MSSIKTASLEPAVDAVLDAVSAQCPSSIRPDELGETLGHIALLNWYSGSGSIRSNGHADRNALRGFALHGEISHAERVSLTVLAMGLCGEAGEVADAYKKGIRGKGSGVYPDMVLEIGDVLFYIAMAHAAYAHDHAILGVHIGHSVLSWPLRGEDWADRLCGRADAHIRARSRLILGALCADADRAMAENLRQACSEAAAVSSLILGPENDVWPYFTALFRLTSTLVWVVHRLEVPFMEIMAWMVVKLGVRQIASERHIPSCAVVSDHLLSDVVERASAMLLEAWPRKGALGGEGGA